MTPIEAMARAICDGYGDDWGELSSGSMQRAFFVDQAKAALAALIDSLPDSAVQAGARAAYEANPTLASLKDLNPVISPAIAAALASIKVASRDA